MNKPVQLFRRASMESQEDVMPFSEPPVVMDEGPDSPVPRARTRARSPVVSATETTPGSMAERALVGAILSDNTLFDLVIDIARATDFLDAAAAAAFAGISGILEGAVEGVSHADPITLASLPSSHGVLSVEALQAWRDSAPTEPAAVSSYAQVVCDAASERQLALGVAKAQAILKEDRSLAERADGIQQAVTGASDVRTLPVVSLGAAAISALSKMAARASRGETGIGMSTGFPDLDALLAGLHAGQLIVVAARPGIGKTAFAMSLGLATAAAGYPTVLASMEMEAEELSKRAMSIVSEVDSHAIRIGALSESDWEGIVNAADYLATIPFDVVDVDSVDLTALSNLARRRHRAGKLKLLIVDYVQIMETGSTKKNSNREQEVAALTRGLKKLAMQLGIPIIALSQLNRAVENRASRRPQMSDLRESGAIEQDADVILFIHREAAAESTSVLNAGIEDTAEIIVEKQRAGPTGVVTLGYARRNTRFYSLTPAVSCVRQSPALAA